MKPFLVAAPLFLLVGCGSKGPAVDLLTSGRWSDTEGNCATKYATFANSGLSYFFQGALHPVFKIARIKQDQKDNRVAFVSLKPTPYALDAMKKVGAVANPNTAVTYAFAVSPTHLNAIAAVTGDRGQIGGMLAKTGDQYRDFDLIRCPTE